MDGNARFELTSASPESNFAGNYQKRQRGYPASSLGRSSSFREGSDNNRNVGSVKVKNSRGTATSSGDLPQCLMLEPIALGDPKYPRSGDLKRALGFSAGSNSEENSIGAARLKNSPPAAVGELKRLRSSVADTCAKASCYIHMFFLASGRARKLDEHLNKLNEFRDAMPMPSKKQKRQRNELLTNERSSGSTLKTGSQMHGKPSDSGNQKFDDRPKSVVLNKRIRTSIAEARVECRNNGVLRQPLMVTKERDMLKDNNADFDTVDEKIRRLPAGGEGWDKKIKRKRGSVGDVLLRSVDNNGELKQNMHHKLTIESTLQFTDSTHGFSLRSYWLNFTRVLSYLDVGKLLCLSGASGGSNKLDPIPSPRVTFKNEVEKSTLSRPIKERPLGKVNVKLNNHEDAMCSNPKVKGKASRAPQSGSMAAANSSVNVPCLSGTLESWEQPQDVNKMPSTGGANNRKLAMPAGSCSPPITQWVGQRPHKISRTRRRNLVPVSNHNVVQMQSEANGNQNFPSPVRLSESEESGADEDIITDKGVGGRELEENTANVGQSVGSAAVPIKQNKILVKEETGYGVRRQGCSGRVSPFSTASISPTREKLDNVGPTMPLRNAKSGSGKTGRYRMIFGADGTAFNFCVSSISCFSSYSQGESDDDREELLTAANLACSSSFNACSSPFWKTNEDLFTSVGPDEKSYLSDQLKLAEELCASLAQNCNNGNSVQAKLDAKCNQKMRASDSISCQRTRCMKNENELRDSSDRMDFVELLDSSLCGCSDAEKRFGIVSPLYQRVLSALIMDDEIEDSEETGFGIPRSSVNGPFLTGSENKIMDMLDFCKPVFRVQNRKNGNAYNCGYVHPESEMLVQHFQYEQMCLEEKLVVELQSVGLFLEAMPALDDKEDEVFNQEIAQLKRRLHERIGKKKTRLNKLCKATQEDNIERDPEQVAMDYLVELTYKKILVSFSTLNHLSAELHNLENFAPEKLYMWPTFSEEDLIVGRSEQQMKTLFPCLNMTLRSTYRGEVREEGYMLVFEWAARSLLIIRKKKKKKEKYREKVRMVEQEGTWCILLDQATGGSFPSKDGIAKVPKQVALAFIKRTLARYHKFKDSGASCFSEPALREIISATSVSPQFAETGLISGVKLALVNDEISMDASCKNGVAKAGRSSVSGSKGDRKTKAKSKQKTTQFSMSGNTFVDKFTDTGELANNGGNMKKDDRFMSSGNAPPLSSKETKESMDLAKLQLNDGIEELSVDSEVGAPQDINAWFNFDVDGLPDDDCIGLEIPNDDLSDLNFF
ncbi:hypothetical protein DH2020_030335 [Rehmannia glutinosa]|uniref:Uncharacterized protein n=1 Tax=Rehmannia glutinosa TaxID=99300 RepID=A0ABR0VL28_REHGL